VWLLRFPTRPGFALGWRACRAALRACGSIAAALCVVVAAAAAEPDWAGWERLIDTRPAQAQRVLSQVDASAWAPDTRLRLALLRSLALLELGRSQEAGVLLEALQAEVDANKDTTRQAEWAAYYAAVLDARDDPRRAAQQLGRALTLAQATGSAPLQSYVHLRRIEHYLTERDMRAAAAELETHQRITSAGDNPHLQARHTYWAGIVQMELAKYTDAQTLLRQAARQFREAGNATWESECERMLATVFIDEQRPRDALEPAQRATALLETLDDPLYLAQARSALAVALAAHQRYGEAQALALQALAAVPRSDKTRRLGVLLRQAQVLLLSGDAAGAERVLLREVQPELPPVAEQPTVHRRHQHLLAQARSALGNARGAETAWRAVIELDRADFERVLARQLDAQRGLLEAQGLQRENELLQSRAQAAERALAADARSSALATVGALLLLLGAAGALWWMRRANRRIAAVAATDALTGLLNRRSLLDLGRPAFAAAAQGGGPLSVMILDLDHFKHINDSRGHAAGDEVLRRMGQVLRQVLRRSDQVARWGGEEFVLLLPGASVEQALALAERQRAAVAEADLGLGAEVPLPHATVSIGVASVQAGDADLGALIARADRALYAAKAGGRNRVVAAEGR